MTALQNTIATVPATNALAILAAAVERGADADQLEKLLALQERFERNEAAREYATAYATFQQKCPPIHKGRTAGSGNFSYGYAAYEDVWRIVGPLLGEVGITVSYSTEPHERGVMGTVFLRKGVHVETRTMFVPLPGMKVNDTQQHGAAMSYVKRYLLGAGLNLVFTDEDNDAQGLAETITEEQAVTIQEWLTQTSSNVPKFLAWLGVERLGDIPAARYAEIIDTLKRKQR
jgi:hypothetical protein